MRVSNTDVPFESHGRDGHCSPVGTADGAVNCVSTQQGSNNKRIYRAGTTTCRLWLFVERAVRQGMQ